MELKREIESFKIVFIQVLKQFLRKLVIFSIIIGFMIGYVLYLDATSPFKNESTNISEVQPIPFHYDRSEYQFIIFSTSDCKPCNELVGDLLTFVNSTQIKIVFIDVGIEQRKYYMSVVNITNISAVPTTIIIYNGTPIVVAVGTFTRLDPTSKPIGVVDDLFWTYRQYTNASNNSLIVITNNISVVTGENYKIIKDIVDNITKRY